MAYLNQLNNELYKIVRNLESSLRLAVEILGLYNDTIVLGTFSPALSHRLNFLKADLLKLFAKHPLFNKVRYIKVKIIQQPEVKALPKVKRPALKISNKLLLEQAATLVDNPKLQQALFSLSQR